MKYFIATIAVLFASLCAFSQVPEFAKLDSFFTSLEENDRFFGSVAVAQDGELLYSKAIGYADLERSIPNTNETKFRIGSISKTFTASLIMIAVEEGRVDLDETIEKRFPSIQNSEKITVRQLLQHRSGINTFTDRSFFSWYTEAITKEALLDTIVGKGSGFSPGTDFSYSNSNYVLLTYILEDVFNKSYAKILDEYIVKPLQLSNTSYGGKIDTKKKEANSYRMKDDWTLETEGHMSIPLGAGGIVSTPSDLCRFSKALFSGELVSRKSLEEMKPSDKDSYGFALEYSSFGDLSGIGHGGDIDAFTSTLAFFEESGISIALTCNGSNFGKHDIVIAVLSEILEKPYEIPLFEYIALTSEELADYIGQYESEDLPMDMIISANGNDLELEVVGQDPAILTAEGNHVFSIVKYGVKITFQASEEKMIFEQQGIKFELNLKKANEELKLVSQGVSNLSQYTGVYKSDLLPMDLTISEEGNVLIAQGTGQPSFRLKDEGEHVFSNKEIGLSITFVPSEDKMSFIQGGALYEMLREKSPEQQVERAIGLGQYLGVYTSDMLPMDLTISEKDQSLIGQGTGQPSFSLKAEGENVFTNEEIGLKITFDPDQDKMRFVQGGTAFVMTRKE